MSHQSSTSGFHCYCCGFQKRHNTTEWALSFVWIITLKNQEHWLSKCCYPPPPTLVGYLCGVAEVHNLRPCFSLMCSKAILYQEPKIKDTWFYQIELLSTVCNALFFIRNTHSVTTQPQETQCSFKTQWWSPRYPDENGFIQTSHQPSL